MAGPLRRISGETDNYQHCARCSRLRANALTVKDLAKKAAHYVAHSQTWPLLPDDAYQLAAIYVSGHGTNGMLNGCAAQCLADGGVRCGPLSLNPTYPLAARLAFRRRSVDWRLSRERRPS